MSTPPTGPVFISLPGDILNAEAGIELGLVEFLADGQQFIAVGQHPSGARYPTPGAMATLPQQQRASAGPAPRLGQHTDEVLAERLGLTTAQIGRLHDQGLISSDRKN